MKEEGQRGCSGTIMKREALEQKQFWGRINQAEMICNCVTVSFWHHLSSSRSVKARMP